MISAACHQLIRFPIARKITSCIFIARSIAALGYDSISTSWIDALTPDRLPSGHFTCYFHRTYHVLTTGRLPVVDLPLCLCYQYIVFIFSFGPASLPQTASKRKRGNERLASCCGAGTGVAAAKYNARGLRGNCSKAMAERMQKDIANWVERIRQGDVPAISRAISWIEDGEAQGQELLQALLPHTGRAALIGVTGAVGSGKSNLVDCLAALLQTRGKTVGILAVDPSSPFSGGALLGDRIRMRTQANDAGAYIRSMATRGSLGGVSRATLDAARVLDAAGKEYILIETVGVGQAEVEIARLADVTLVLLAPGMGDDVQAMKAGVMEIADVFVLNKSDLPGAERVEQEVQSLWSVAPRMEEWQPPIVKTVATENKGVEQLLEAIEKYRDFSKAGGRRKLPRVSQD